MKVQLAVSALGVFGVAGVVTAIALGGAGGHHRAQQAPAGQPIVVVTSTVPASTPAPVKHAAKPARKAVVSHSTKQRHAVSHIVVRSAAVANDPTDPAVSSDPPADPAPVTDPATEGPNGGPLPTMAPPVRPTPPPISIPPPVDSSSAPTG